MNNIESLIIDVMNFQEIGNLQIIRRCKIQKIF